MLTHVLLGKDGQLIAALGINTAIPRRYHSDILQNKINQNCLLQIIIIRGKSKRSSPKFVQTNVNRQVKIRVINKTYQQQNNYMHPLERQAKKPVFFFNSQTSYMERTGEMKGYKIKLKDEDKLIHLKTRYLDRSAPHKPRAFVSSDFDDNEANRRSFETFKSRSFHKRFNKFKKEAEMLSYDDSDFIISAESNSLPKQKLSREMPYFQSSNLEGRMNQYLNLIIRKSQQNHQERVRQLIQGEKQLKSKAHNMFLRRMKISQNRKKQQKDKQDSLMQINVKANKGKSDTIYNLKQMLKRAQFEFEKQL